MAAGGRGLRRARTACGMTVCTALLYFARRFEAAIVPFGARTEYSARVLRVLSQGTPSTQPGYSGSHLCPLGRALRREGRVDHANRRGRPEQAANDAAPRPVCPAPPTVMLAARSQRLVRSMRAARHKQSWYGSAYAQPVRLFDLRTPDLRTSTARSGNGGSLSLSSSRGVAIACSLVMRWITRLSSDADACPFAMMRTPDTCSAAAHPSRAPSNPSKARLTRLLRHRSTAHGATCCTRPRREPGSGEAERHVPPYRGARHF